MLASVAPEQFDEWIVFRTIEPDPSERLAEILKRGFRLLAAGNGITVPDEALDILPGSARRRAAPGDSAARRGIGPRGLRRKGIRMATAIGELVAKLGVDNSQFSSGLRQSADDLQEHGSRMEGLWESIGGSSRSFRFLGHAAEEAGEGIGRTNAALGETVSGLGGMLSGVGEAVHGYHALHQVIGLATNFIPGLGQLKWLQMAIKGVSLLGGAFLAFGGSAKKAGEEAKKVQEAVRPKALEFGSAEAFEAIAKAGVPGAGSGGAFAAAEQRATAAGESKEKGGAAAAQQTAGDNQTMISLLTKIEHNTKFASAASLLLS